ncbi:MAG TPA: hypothetical protein VKA70_11640, partial [Blastocatellia bacterium]|nr:hypothetical protein [Blastocatellia bacterium]
MFRGSKYNQGKTPAGAKADQGEQPPAGKRLPKPNPVSQSLAMRSIAAQSKPSVSQPGDPHEREADHIADQVTRSPQASSPALTPPSADIDQSEARRKSASLPDTASPAL